MQKLLKLIKSKYALGILLIATIIFFDLRRTIENPFGEKLPEKVSMRFYGLKNNFYLKERKKNILSEDKKAKIWNFGQRFEPIFQIDFRGGDWEMAISTPQSKKWTDILYLREKENGNFVFKQANRFYKNDSLANYLLSLIELDSIRDSNKYKIPSWD